MNFGTKCLEKILLTFRELKLRKCGDSRRKNRLAIKKYNKSQKPISKRDDDRISTPWVKISEISIKVEGKKECEFGESENFLNQSLSKRNFKTWPQLEF